MRGVFLKTAESNGVELVDDRIDFTKERREYLWALPDNVSVRALPVLAEVCGSDECHGAELAGVGPYKHFSSELSNGSRAETIGLRILNCALHILL